MINNDSKTFSNIVSSSLSFSIHNQSLAPSFSVPELDVYQSQKNIQVVSVNQDPLFFETDSKSSAASSAASGASSEEAAHNAFFNMRLELAMGKSHATASPSYFPGAVIPGPGGASCSEFNRGNLLFAQFVHVLSFDDEMLARLLDENTVAAASLFCREATTAEDWQWQYVVEPKLYFIHQCSQQKIERRADSQALALAALSQKASALLAEAAGESFSDQTLIALLTLISQAWFSPISGIAPITWDSVALSACRQVLNKHIEQIEPSNILPVLFEVEAMTSHVSLDEKRESFARGVFAGNFIDVALAPITSIKATEFCVRERLFDEVINLSSRGFAPVIINEYGLVADGNHRLTAAYVWNILKYCQDLDWSLENDEFQKRVAGFAAAVQNGLLKEGTSVSPVSLHQALSHLAYFLRRPDWRARLNSYTRPLLKKHDFIHALPVVVLPEYLSGAVVKAGYDDGTVVERACPSIYEAMSLNEHLVLPPRASYHFTDAALLPWFTVLKTSCGTKRRTGSFSRRPRSIHK